MIRYLVRNAAHELAVMAAGRLGFVPVARLEEVEAALDRAEANGELWCNQRDRAVDNWRTGSTELAAAKAELEKLAELQTGGEPVAWLLEFPEGHPSRVATASLAAAEDTAARTGSEIVPLYRCPPTTETPSREDLEAVLRAALGDGSGDSLGLGGGLSLSCGGGENFIWIDEDGRLDTTFPEAIAEAARRIREGK